ncbi:hypothetical protein WA026_021050 [Henosepilachna vigintioctopunctata]|uniref:Uncharacterized protein n=1 Tax=Henosepilachna vigintioctopunctata TaxID=420089 RepID=A0AAW1V4L0_9CUCU
MYRSPTRHFNTFLLSLDSLLGGIGTNKRITLAADFNMHFGTFEALALRLCDIVAGFGMQQTIKKATRNHDWIIFSAKIAANDDYINSSSNPTKSMWRINNKNSGNMKGNNESSGLTSEDFNNYFLGIASEFVHGMEESDTEPLENLGHMDIPHHFSFHQVTFN